MTNRRQIRALVTTACSFIAAVFLLFASGCSTGGAARSTEPWTILCLELHEPAQASQIDELATVLRRTPGVRQHDVYTVHRDDGSAGLYYGGYRRKVDPTTQKTSFPPQMRKDLGFLRELGDGANRRIFFQALPVRTPVPDVGFQDWKLENARGLYSLQVARFEPRDDFMEFKQAAAEYCRILRDLGFEAYFHHSDSGSAVTVGSFGADAIRQNDDGKTIYAPHVTALQQKEHLQHNLVNGAIVRVRDHSGVFYAVPSTLVEIPRHGR